MAEGIRLHPRELIVRDAKNKIEEVVMDQMRYHDITLVELVVILNEIQRTYAGYLLRQERHPDDPGKRSGEA